MAELVRMVRCVYVRENDGWVPMGRARTRCPRCGAVVEKNPLPAVVRGRPVVSYHVVELREAGS